MSHGKESETDLLILLNNMIGEDFVFQSPILMEESGKKIELTDFLILLDDILISIQSKSIEINIDDITDIKLGRIFKKYESAKSQLNRTINSARREEKVSLNANHLNDQIELPWNNFKTKIFIITLNIPDNLYEDPEFRFQFVKFETYKEIALHTFILQDLKKISGEIKTGGDLLHYLENREVVLNAAPMHQLINELDIMALYKIKYDTIEKIKNGEINHFIITPGLWESYQKDLKEKIEERDRLLTDFNLINTLIKEKRNSISYSIEKFGYSKDQTIQNYLRIIGILSLLSSIDRYHVEKALKEKIASSNVHSRGYFIFSFRNKAILFLISNETDRERRMDQLVFFSEQGALYINKTRPEAETFLGVATEGRNAPGRSFDSALFSIEDAIHEVEEFDGQLFENRDFGKVDEWTI
ncbi:hypothetical protein [Leptospira kmetyi]|uniref:Uncharacterized protein n=1 Tax=Leptospira kmetyi TaxID=408139 RepID=A0ABX4N4R9_9LEPT|nr:hypothetical protein [Leptospira kmetyi]PJZ28305.1 hypothetical protein CH378_18450 [Leptospira kmetyi]